MIWQLLQFTLIPAAVASMAFGQPAERMPFGEPDEFPPPLIHTEVSQRTIELLTAALAKSPPVHVRVQLVNELALCADERALPPVRAALDDVDPAVRVAAVRALARRSDVQSVAALDRLSSDSDRRVRISVVQAAGKFAVPGVVDRALSQSDPVVFLAAARVATTPEHDAAIAGRLPTLPASVKSLVIDALRSRNSDAARDAVRAALATDSIPVVIAAIETLNAWRMIEDGPAYERLLIHAHPSVRRSAVKASAHLSPGRQRAIAEIALADADPTVQIAAAQRLEEHPSSTALAGLLQCLDSSDEQVNQAARAAVAAAIVAGVAPATQVVALLDHADAARRANGSAILGLARSMEGIERHQQLINDPSPDVVLQAIRSLGEIGSKSAGRRIAAIITVVADSGADWAAIERPEIIGAAFVACGKLDEQSVLPVARLLAPQKTTCPYSIRGPAIWAVGALGASQIQEVTPQLWSIFRDNSPYEVEAARVEAMRAIGNLGDPGALDEVTRESQQQPLPALRWIAHRVRERLSGEQDIPYDPPIARIRPELSIEDLSGPIGG